MAPLTPSPPWDWSHQPKGPRGRQRDLARDPQPVWKFFLPPAGSATEHPRDKGCLSPCPGPPWHQGLSRPYHVDSQHQVLLVRFLLLQPLQGLEQSLPTQKASHDTAAGSELPPGQPSTPRSPSSPKTSEKGTLNLHRAAGRLAGGQIPCGPQPGVCLEDALTPRGFQPPTSISFCFW